MEDRRAKVEDGIRTRLERNKSTYEEGVSEYLINNILSNKSDSLSALAGAAMNDDLDALRDFARLVAREACEMEENPDPGTLSEIGFVVMSEAIFSASAVRRETLAK